MRIGGIETYSGPVHAAWALGLMGSIAAMATLAGLQDPWWIGAAYGAAFYHGREQRDAEAKIGVVGKVLAPWQWHAKSQWDFWLPGGVCLLAAVIAEVLA